MRIDLSEIIKKLKKIQAEFNGDLDPTKRVACLDAINHIAENELKFQHDNLIYKNHLQASMTKFDIDL